MHIDMTALRALEREKDISFEVVVEAIESALLSAYHKTPGAHAHARVDLDKRSGDVTVWARERLDAEGEQKFELSHSLVIICPDCGKNIAFRGRCPKCAGNSWIPAGQSGGIFEQMKAQRLRRMIGEDEDDTLTRQAMHAAADAEPVQ